MNKTRREFLRQSGVGVLGVAAATPGSREVLGAPRRARSSQKPTLIAVYLRGGADPLGTIAPHADRQLPKVRPSLTIPGPSTTSPHRLLPLDDMFGFNPNMKALHELYENQMCAPIVCVDSPHPTRSHFDAQDGPLPACAPCTAAGSTGI